MGPSLDWTASPSCKCLPWFPFLPHGSAPSFVHSRQPLLLFKTTDMRRCHICVEMGPPPSGKRGWSSVKDSIFMYPAMSVSLSPAQPGDHSFTFCNFLKLNDVGQLKTIREFVA